MPTKFDSLKRRLWYQSGDPMETPAQKLRAHLHFQLTDHAFLRIFWTNMFQIAPGVWRSNQPSPARLRKMHAMGIHTVLNLRGKNKSPAYLLEAQTCKELGIELIDHSFAARSLFPSERYLALLDTFETIDKPFVMHCKSGADRAGLASAMYLIHIEGKTPDEAMQMMGLKYIHLKFTKTGILDAFLRAYRAAYNESGISLRDWLETAYDREAVYASFKAPWI